jgi:hypothetical protein
MFAKFENVAKASKVMKEEKSYYYERKIQQLEAELQSLSQLQDFVQRVTEIVVPRMQDLLEVNVRGQAGH